jgi:hypothetical protein
MSQKNSITPIFMLRQVPSLFLLALLIACSQPPFLQPPNFPQNDMGRLPDVNLQVYIQPQRPLGLGKQNTYLTPLYLPQRYDKALTVSYAGIVQDIFLQRRIFQVLEQHRDLEKAISRAALKDRGFHYLMEISAPSFLAPAGNSRGWVALDLKLIRLADDATLWHIYGEADLIPLHRGHDILFPRDYREAPTITEGLAAIVHKMADVISSQETGAALP